MTPQEMIDVLSSIGDSHEVEFHDGLNGYFCWDLLYENGDLVLAVSFEDPEAPLINTEIEWILTPKKRG